MVDTIIATVNDVSPTPEALRPTPPAYPPLPSRNRRLAAWIAVALVVVLTVTALTMAWRAQQRVRSLEQELVRRQQDSQGDASEARVLSREAQEAARDASAKVALFEMKLAEVSLQRTQLDDLIQTLSRSRDENMLVDIEAAIRVALQQSAITGSAEPMVAALRQADERLARDPQPRFEPVRRAVARDLDKVRAVSVADLSTLTIKLDEAARMVDELPLLAAAEPRRSWGGNAPADTAPVVVSPVVDAASADGASGTSAEASGARAGFFGRIGWPSWMAGVSGAWSTVTDRVWYEAQSLVRVTHIEHPEAMLMSPDQAFFFRENLKLRLLNARLALLSRQYDTTQSDLRTARASVDRYFDANSRKTVLMNELIAQVASQARAVSLPRPDETLAALAAAAAIR